MRLRRTVVAPAGIRICGIVAAAMLAGTLVLAQHHGAAGPPCIFWIEFHIHCPGCGITRSLAELWRGHLWLALRYHPLGPPVFALLVAASVAGALHWLRPSLRSSIESSFNRFIAPRNLKPVAGLMILIWVVRLGLGAAHVPLFIW